MRNLLSITFILVAFVTMPLHAQRYQGAAETAEERATRQTERMKENLDLSDEQVPKVREINLNFIQKQAEAKSDASYSRVGMREAMVKLREARQADLKEVLNDAQFEKMKQQEKEMMNNSRQTNRPYSKDKSNRGGGKNK